MQTIEGVTVQSNPRAQDSAGLRGVKFAHNLSNRGAQARRFDANRPIFSGLIFGFLVKSRQLRDVAPVRLASVKTCLTRGRGFSSRT